MKATKYPSVGEGIAEIDRNVEGLTTQPDKAVFHTSRAETDALEYARENDAVTLSGFNARIAEFDNKSIETESYGDYGTPYGAALEELRLDRTQDKHDLQTRKAASLYRDRIWDHASRIYAENASGRVEIFIGCGPGAKEGSKPTISELTTFARVERDALLDNKDVTHINGIKREVLQKYRDSQIDKAAAVDVINSKLISGQESRGKSISERERVMSELDLSQTSKQQLPGKRAVSGGEANKELGPYEARKKVLSASSNNKSGVSKK